jgi:hypothetical protein
MNTDMKRVAAVALLLGLSLSAVAATLPQSDRLSGAVE